jgi:opacity protein-like surface antigen
MKTLFAAIVLTLLLVSCAEFAALVTPATPVFPRSLTKSERGEFATHKEFITLKPMFYMESTKSLISLKTVNAYGSALGKEDLVQVPEGTRLSVTRFVEEGHIDSSWENRKSKNLYGNMVLKGRTTKGVSLGIRAWQSDIPAYDRELVAPVSEAAGVSAGTQNRKRLQ